MHTFDQIQKHILVPVRPESVLAGILHYRRSLRAQWTYWALSIEGMVTGNEMAPAHQTLGKMIVPSGI